jgi:SusD family.
MKKLIFVFLSVITLLTGCDDVFTPALENNLSLDKVYNNANYAQGLLLDGYARISDNSWSFNDVATDDAVTNDKTSGYLKMATGQWTSNYNPLDQWKNSFSAIQYLNLFLSVSDSVKWANDTKVRTMFNDRMKGEAYGLRALFMYYLLQNHAGVTEDGTLLGVPILLKYQDALSSEFNRPRASFDDCMKQLYADLDKAEELLPLDFEDIADDAQVPAKYSSQGINKNDYNRVFGVYFRLRMTARIAKAVRAKAALLAASPAYNNSPVNNQKWIDAANSAGQLISLKGGVSGLASNGLTWYSNSTEIDALAAGVNPAEILWRSDMGASNDNALEKQYFPPTLYGNGRINPTQNLVDAFPSANGYPISDVTNSGYSSSKPYDNRDPRLKLFVLVNGATAGTGNTKIYTSVDGGTNDGLNKVETSTRTGYYMRKLLRQDVNLNPSSTTGQKHYKPRIRYTEVYLIYAEAANEAWGPKGTGSFTFSAYDVIKAIRKRALALTSDPYLESIADDKDKMRELIRNERRLELCFEGFRFWDLRRWSSNLTESASGMKIENGLFTPISGVEVRDYKSYMNFGPIPYSEILKYNALEQNSGWK